jgi:hypothetical protein
LPGVCKHAGVYSSAAGVLAISFLALVIGRSLISRLASVTQRISASCLAAWWVPTFKLHPPRTCCG